jgi:hypothetical protein
VGLGVFQGLCTKKEHLRQVRAVIAASRYRHHRHRQPCEIYVCLIGADVEVSPWSMAAVIMMVDFRGSSGRCEKNIWFPIVRCGAVHFFYWCHMFSLFATLFAVASYLVYHHPIRSLFHVTSHPRALLQSSLSLPTRFPSNSTASLHTYTGR